MRITKAVQSPSQGDVHVNRPLTNISVAYVQDESAFVADTVFPTVSVEMKSDQYWTFPIGEFNRDEMEERAPGAESAGSGYALSRDSYLTRVRALHKDIPDQIRANEDNPLNSDRQATQWLTRQSLINRERNWTSNFLKTGVWDVQALGHTARAANFNPLDAAAAANRQIIFWNDASSTPIEDVRLMKQFVLRRTGFMPNTMTMSRRVFDAVVDHPDIIARLNRGQTTGPAMTNREQLAALWELERILVMDAVWNSEDLGEDADMDFISGRHALLTYSPGTPGLMTPAAGYTFAWTGFLGAAANGMRMKRFRMEARESDRVEIQSAYDHKLVGSALGAFFENIVEEDASVQE